MIDKRIGKRIKQRREELGITQEDLAEQLGLPAHYLSTVERGATFPRIERLIDIINGLDTSADAIFCDVIVRSSDTRASILSEQIGNLPLDERNKILDMVELMIRQAKKE